MGIFAADLCFRTQRLPLWGETVIGGDFQLGPGGKGSNQAVAAARLGGTVHFISKVGADPFGREIARSIYREVRLADLWIFFLHLLAHATGGAAAIIVDPILGRKCHCRSARRRHTALTIDDINQARACIASSGCFMTQLELSVPLVEHGLRMAHSLGVPTILNPACMRSQRRSVGALPLCDPKRVGGERAHGAAGWTHVRDRGGAAEFLLRRGPRHVVITLGARGAFVCSARLKNMSARFRLGPSSIRQGPGTPSTEALPSACPKA